MLANQAFREMDDQTLIDEFKKWDSRIKGATSWGAAVGVADNFRRQCETLIRERGLEHYITDLV